MSERFLLDSEPTFSWAQMTLDEHRKSGENYPFTLMRLEKGPEGMEAVVEIPNQGGEPFRRLGRVATDESQSPEDLQLRALQDALQTDYPQVKEIKSVENSSLYAGNSTELLFNTGESYAFNSYATGERSQEIALVEGVAAILLKK